jgi:hypothetical protein
VDTRAKTKEKTDKKKQSTGKVEQTAARKLFTLR